MAQLKARQQNCDNKRGNFNYFRVSVDKWEYTWLRSQKSRRKSKTNEYWSSTTNKKKESSSSQRLSLMNAPKTNRQEDTANMMIGMTELVRSYC